VDKEEEGVTLTDGPAGVGVPGKGEPVEDMELLRVIVEVGVVEGD